jgi:hypothetical protein
MLVSEECPMKTHKHQWLWTMPYPLKRLPGATRGGHTMAPEVQNPSYSELTP